MPVFIPLGIPDYDGKKERDFIQFTYGIEEIEAVELIVQIRDGSDVWYEEKIYDEAKLSIGEHIWEWDGFDNNGVLDSARFKQAKNLNFHITVKDVNGYTDQGVTNFENIEGKIKWVDAKIDKNNKRIDITLRVNLKEGRPIGTEEDCTTEDELICPWENIPDTVINQFNGIPAFRKPIKSFIELEQLVIEGINFHWARNNNNSIAKNIIVNGEAYEVYVNTINTEINAMEDISLVFNTNNKFMRSANPGKVQNFTSAYANLFNKNVIYYNVGYIKYDIEGWYYESFEDEDLRFKETSAHEIGHTILTAFGGTCYSYGHKGSSTLLQKRKKNAPKFPEKGEIDIMPYYNDNSAGTRYQQNNYFERTVASEKDVSSLLWLTKIEFSQKK